MNQSIGRGRWLKRLLITLLVLVCLLSAGIWYLRQPAPLVSIPVTEQPPLPKALPHSLGSLPYATVEWPTVHGGPANNDYVPIKQGVEFEQEWEALAGMATVVAPTTGPEGHLYQTTGNPPGQSNLFALDRQGNILWQTPPWQSGDGFDSCAALNAPVIDNRGDLYVADCNQFWAFRADGQVKWTIDLPAPRPDAAFQDPDELVSIANPDNPEQQLRVKRLTEMRTFVTAFFTADGSVGGITVWGDVVIVDRETGVSKIRPYRLPGSPPPPTEAPPFDKFMVGLMDGRLIQPLFDLVAGRTFNSSNTPAVNARDGRIFVVATGEEPNTGALYGLDYFPAGRPGELGKIVLASETVIGKESGSSPSISPDGSQVNLADETGKLYVVDSSSGDLLCVSAGLGILAGSPTIGSDGTVLVLTETGAAALHPDNCQLKWELDLDWLIQRDLPANFEWLLGKRYVAGGGTIAVTDSGLIMPVILGYRLPLGETGMPLAVKSYYLNIHPETGTLLSGSVPYEADDTNDGWVVPLKDGQLVYNNGSMRSSLSQLFAPLVNPVLSLQGMRLLEPRGGLVSLRAVRFPDSPVDHGR